MLVLPVKAGRRYPPAMSRHPDAHIAETNEIVAELEAAGLVTVTQRADGEPVYTLTPAGEQVANQMALTCRWWVTYTTLGSDTPAHSQELLGVRHGLGGDDVEIAGFINSKPFTG